jgi:hypothetical protein
MLILHNDANWHPDDEASAFVGVTVKADLLS